MKSADLMAQVHQATYSPSPSRRILEDPSLVLVEPSERSKEKSTHSRKSRSPKRRAEHRSLVVAAFAIAEEERQGKHLKSLLRTSAERLEQEMRRTAEATMRADFAERREQEALQRANDAEANNERLQQEITSLERDMRRYQMQLEASELSTKELREDLADTRQELREMERGERKAQEKVQRYHLIIQDYEREQGRIQGVADDSYEDGREDGYKEGYDVGFEDGRKAGIREGLKQGRQGVFDRILANDGDGDEWVSNLPRTSATQREI